MSMQRSDADNASMEERVRRETGLFDFDALIHGVDARRQAAGGGPTQAPPSQAPPTTLAVTPALPSQVASTPAASGPSPAPTLAAQAMATPPPVPSASAAPAGAESMPGALLSAPDPGALERRQRQPVSGLHAESHWSRPAKWLALLMLIPAIGIPGRMLLRPQVTAPAAAAPNPHLKQGLPDPGLTPGERRGSGTAAVEPAPEDQRRVFTAYGLAPDDERYRVCRLIPRGLGGTSSPRNLFPATPWFVELKGRLDRHLVREVQAGRLSADQAADQLRKNWVRAVHSNYIRNYGLTDPERARAREKALGW